MLFKRVFHPPEDGQFYISGVVNDQLFICTIRIALMTKMYFYFLDANEYKYRLPKTKFKWMVELVDDNLYLTTLIRPMYYSSSGNGTTLLSIFNEFDDITLEVHGIEFVGDEVLGPLLASVHVGGTPLYQLMMESGNGTITERMNYRDFTQCHGFRTSNKPPPEKPYRNTEYGEWFDGP